MPRQCVILIRVEDIAICIHLYYTALELHDYSKRGMRICVVRENHLTVFRYVI